jgi:DNA uptake protein ComE-like DNA-binding protein
MNFFLSIRSTSALLAGVVGFIPLSAEDQRARNSGPSSSATAAEGARLDLNTADEKTLAAVAVIGPEVARKIVAARPFTTINDLDRIKGLTAEQLEQVRATVTVATIHVPTKPGVPTANSSKQSPGDDVRKKVDLNTADVETLVSTPSIGPQAARAIVAARPFESVDGLSRVKGLTTEQLELIRLDVTVTPVERSPRTPLGEP